MSTDDDPPIDGVFRQIVSPALATAAAAAAPRVLRASAGETTAWAALVTLPGGGVWQAVFGTRAEAVDALAAIAVSAPVVDD